MMTTDAELPLITEVHPALYIGGSFARMPATAPAFDLALTVCSPIEARYPAPARAQHAYPLQDSPYVATLDYFKAEQVSMLAESVCTALDKGHSVLVRCALGLNRSALVAGVVLARLTDRPGAEIIEHLRSVRSRRVLNNAAFVRHLKAIEPPPPAPTEPSDTASAWRMWRLTSDRDGPALAPPMEDHWRVARGPVFMASCRVGCAEPPGPGCKCGIYVMANDAALSTIDNARWADDVAGPVWMMGRVLPGPPPPIGFLGELRAAGVELAGTQFVLPKYQALCEPLSERYGVPFAVRDGSLVRDMPNGRLRMMIEGAGLLGLDVDVPRVRELPSDYLQRLYIGASYLGIDPEYILRLANAVRPNRTEES